MNELQLQDLDNNRIPSSMTWRLVLAGVVLAAVAAITGCSNEAHADPGSSALPDELVGSWCGGSNADPDGHWTWTFEPDGRFSAYNSAASLTGYAVLEDGPKLVVYPDGGTATAYSISIDDYGLLYLNDYSYVSGSCDS